MTTTAMTMTTTNNPPKNEPETALAKSRSLLKDKLMLVRKDEWPPLLWSLFYFFFLLCGYYLLRPVRDEMGIRAGVKTVNQLFTVVFFVMLIITPVFGYLFSRFPRRKLLPYVYLFFGSHLFVFWVLFATQHYVVQATVVFFVWVSVFNLFAVSVFWSFMADLWNTEQAKRLYGFVSAGGTAGAIAGPSLATLLVRSVGPLNLLLVALACLLISVVFVFKLSAWSRQQLFDEAPKTTQKPPSIWVGIQLALSSPYLRGICGYLILFTVTSTVLYLQQVEIIRTAIQSSTERTALLARIDLSVNVLVLVLQLFVLRPLWVKLGLVAGLALAPLVGVAGFVGLAMFPKLTVLVVFLVLARASEYAIAKPSRETLFNVLSPVEKYQAKNFMDTAVCRAGDMAGSWLCRGLSALGFGNVAVSFLAASLCALWMGVAAYLSHSHKRLQTDPQ